MSDESLLAIVENKSDEYTPDALALTNEEISRRGGIESLMQRVQQSREEKQDSPPQETHRPQIPDQSNEVVARLKRFYWVPVVVAYGLFLYVIRGSLWLYWLCVFAMIAFWIRVLINARKLTPEEEYAEIAKEMEKHADSVAKGEQQLDDQE
jgi:hypothetical protein